jgi:hypothetical protein
MNKTTFSRNGFALLAAVSLATWTLLIWQHFNGGVPSHSFMARKDMPSISNWWGAILLPLLTCFSLFRLEKRLFTDENEVVSPKKMQAVLGLFFAGLLYAGAMAFCFMTDKKDINGVLFPSLFLWALLFPLYRAEFFLGFVMGMTYTFGAILPTFIASVFVALSYVAHKFLYPLVLKIFGKKAVKN